MPPKAWYMKLENDPTTEFEFFLAAKLGKTISELRRMDCDEFLGWNVYYARKNQREQLEILKASK